MDEQAIKMSEEITRLREEQKMTFKAIGEVYHISPSRVSYLYQAFLRRRRIARYRELHEQENQMTVCVKMTLGELVVLQRVLSLYHTWALQENSRSAHGGNPLFKEPDCVTAGYLEGRFRKIEGEKREEARKREVLTPSSY